MIEYALKNKWFDGSLKPKVLTRDEKKKIVDVKEEKPKPKTKKIEYVEEKPIDKKVFGKDAAIPPRGNKK